MIESLIQLGEFLLPTSCSLCHRRQAKPVCEKCLQELSTFKTRRCIVCANPFHGWICKSCRKDPPHFDATNCLTGEESRLFIPVQSLRSRHGFHHIPGIIYAWHHLASRHCPPVDLIIPSPWVSSRISSHGFHPSWELAKRMAKKTRTPCFPHLILRGSELSIENIPKTKILRTQYLSRTCYLNPDLPSDINAKLKGLRVAVVSDFMHTGATLNVVARILKENGVHWVSNWVILRTRQVEKM